MTQPEYREVAPDAPERSETPKRLPRTRGAVNGFLLVLLGAWGALAPMIGPYLNLGYQPDQAWTMTAARFWLEVLPGIVVLISGLALIASVRRTGGVFWAWLAAAGGAWFIVGRTVSMLWNNGQPQIGAPAAGSTVGNVVTELVFFTGLGALIVFLASVALGRFTFGATQRIVERVPMGGADVAPPQQVGPQRWWRRGRADEDADAVRTGAHRHGLSH